MGNHHRELTRRHVLGRTARGLVGGWAVLQLPRPLMAAVPAAAPGASAPSRAALIHGQQRADNVFRALELIKADVVKRLTGKKRVVVKPNVVWVSKQLSATHADCLEGILEFLSPLYKGEIIIADSPAQGSVTEGYENYDYYRLQRKYKVRFLDLDEEPTVVRHVSDQRYRPRAVRMSRLLLDPDTFVVSSAVMKTHDRAVATLSLKNVVVGAAIKDRGFRWGAKEGGSNDKTMIHGGPANEAIHYNLFSLARRLRPDLSVIDGFEGMEGNGPVGGTPVDHKVAVASTDFLAADRVAVELMGFEFARVGYLTFCADAGLGQGDLNRIEVDGARISDHIRAYRPHDNIERQYKWMTRG